MLNNAKKSYIKQVVVNWEIMRLIYNFVLLVVGLGTSYPFISKIGEDWYVIQAVVYGLVANVCFCFGPLAELYLYAFGIKIAYWRYLLFGIGLGFSIALTLAGVMFYSFAV